MITDKGFMEYRKSRQRDRILEILRETRTHPTADWIYRKLKEDLPDLSLGTVYRNLKVLEEQGHILKLPFGSTFDRFEAKIAPHYHIVCEKCGLVEDFEMAQCRGLNEKAEKMSSFRITHHRIEFFGLCKKCRKESAKRSVRKSG